MSGADAIGDYLLVVNWAGTSEQFAVPGVPITTTLQVYGEVSRTRKASFQVRLPYDVVEAIEEGWDPVELQGTLFDPAGRVVLAGVCTGATTRAGDEHVAFTLEESATTCTATFPGTFEPDQVRLEQRRVTEDTLSREAVFGLLRYPEWLNLDWQSDSVQAAARTKLPAAIVDADTLPDDITSIDGRSGRTYPFPFGSPGGVTSTPYPGSPALPLSNATNAETLMISGGLVDATQVTLYGPDGADGLWSEKVPVSTQLDDQGRRFSRVRLNSATRATGDGGNGFDLDGIKGDWWEEEWWVAWTDGGAGHGNLADLADTLLRASGCRIDWLRMDEQRRELQGWQVDGYIDEQVEPLAYLEQILRPFPASIVTGADGIWVWMWPSWLEHRLTLEELPGVVVVSDDRVDHRRPEVNAWWLRYQVDDRLDQPLKVTSIVTRTAQLSQQRHGVQEQTVTSDVVARDDVAEALARLRLDYFSTPTTRIRLHLDTERFDGLEVGTFVKAVLPSRGIDGRLALVVSVTSDGTPMMDVVLFVLQTRV